MDNNELHALIQLLDDDDAEVYRHVHDKLKSYGSGVIPALEEVWGADLDPATHERLEDIIHEIQFDELTTQWKKWLERESPDLLTGAYLVAKLQYPELQLEEIEKKLFKIKQSIWLELNYSQTPLEQVQIFNQVFYSYHAFSGVQSSKDYQDFCINHVIEAKKGNAISIGIIYQLVAHDLNLPVYGVTLMHHYILACCKHNLLDFAGDGLEREVMFYINPINKGSIFSREEIREYIRKLKVEEKPAYFAPADHISIIRELLHYLIDLYRQQNRDEKVDELNYLMQML